MSSKRLSSGWTPFLAAQAEIWKGLDRPSKIITAAALGGWGASKSTSVARALCKVVARNPWRTAYGETKPISVVVAPTAKILRAATMRAIERTVPKGAILRKRGSPHNDWLWMNGHVTLFWSAEAEFEGTDICGLLVDEISHRTYQEQDKWMNYVARVRDPLASRMAILVAGLPEQGWVREHFEVRPDSPNRESRLTVLSGMLDNLYLPQETIDTYRANCPAGQEEFFLYGRWRMPEHAIYGRFDSSKHLVDDQLKPGVTTHASFDFGERSHILVAQMRPDGLLIGEEIHLEGADTPAQARALKELCSKKQLPIGAGSVINVDPTAKTEQIKPVRDAFPGARVLQTQRGDSYHEIEDGIRCTQRAFLDSTGVVRMRFWRGLVGRRWGIVEAISSYRRNPLTQIPVRDNLRDHALDTMRYLACQHLPEQKPGWKVIR